MRVGVHPGLSPSSTLFCLIFLLSITPPTATRYPPPTSGSKPCLLSPASRLPPPSVTPPTPAALGASRNLLRIACTLLSLAYRGQKGLRPDPNTSPAHGHGSRCVASSPTPTLKMYAVTHIPDRVLSNPAYFPEWPACAACSALPGHGCPSPLITSASEKC